MVFIRAPKIERVGEGVEVIATEGKGDREQNPVLVRKGKTLAATFHPELSDDRRVHQYFLDLVAKDQVAQGSKGNGAPGKT
jgi:pyridoxal 5'-phosphate synthase pdxT subunit